MLNFSPGTLRVPSHVKLKSVDLTVSAREPCRSSWQARQVGGHERPENVRAGVPRLARVRPGAARRATSSWHRPCRMSTRVAASRMVDVGGKAPTLRTAVARGRIRVKPTCGTADSERRDRQGRSAAGGTDRRHHGGQANGGAHPSLPLDPSLAGRSRPPCQRRRIRHRGARPDHGQDRSRDGGVDGRLGGCADAPTT